SRPWPSSFEVASSISLAAPCPACSCPIPWDKRWVVFAKPVARPGIVLDYLARYVHRTALSDKAITACDDRSVTFNYRDSGHGRRKAMTLPAHEFLRRFLQHVPLRGLHRVRAFGLLHPAERTTLRRLQLLLAPAAPAISTSEAARPSRCPAHTAARVRCASSDACPSTSAPLGRSARRQQRFLSNVVPGARATRQGLGSDIAMTERAFAPPRGTAPVRPVGHFVAHF